jgi:hypothetical protein
MKRIKFVVEKNEDGYWAHTTVSGFGVIGGYGETLAELKKDVVQGYNFAYNDNPQKQITEEQIQLSLDLSAFFDLYSGIVAAAGVGMRVGMQKSLISDYKNGVKKASEKQIKKLLLEINKLGRELADIEITPI